MYAFHILTQQAADDGQNDKSVNGTCPHHHYSLSSSCINPILRLDFCLGSLDCSSAKAYDNFESHPV